MPRIDLPPLTASELAAVRASANAMNRRKPKSRVIDNLLYAFRSKWSDGYRCHPSDPHKWTATCPACGEQIGIAEQPWGKWQVLLFCAGGCDEQTVLKALADEHGDSEHVAMLDVQQKVVEAEFARRDRARHARRELQAWQSTKTPSPNTDSMTTGAPGRPAAGATANSRSGLLKREIPPPSSRPGSTSSGPPLTRSSPVSGSGSTETRR